MTSFKTLNGPPSATAEQLIVSVTDKDLLRPYQRLRAVPDLACRTLHAENLGSFQVAIAAPKSRLVARR